LLKNKPHFTSAPIKDDDPLQPDTKQSGNSSMAYPNNSSFTSYDDGLDGKLSRRSSAASEGALQEGARASPVPHLAPIKGPVKRLSSVSSFRRVPASNNSMYLPETPTETRALLSSGILSVGNARQISAVLGEKGMVSTWATLPPPNKTCPSRRPLMMSGSRAPSSRYANSASTELCPVKRMISRPAIPLAASL
jgi:hypothetical protein